MVGPVNLDKLYSPWEWFLPSWNFPSRKGKG
jgi:hypothetical protein